MAWPFAKNWEAWDTNVLPFIQNEGEVTDILQTLGTVGLLRRIVDILNYLGHTEKCGGLMFLLGWLCDFLSCIIKLGVEWSKEEICSLRNIKYSINFIKKPFYKLNHYEAKAYFLKKQPADYWDSQILSHFSIGINWIN